RHRRDRCGDRESDRGESRQGGRGEGKTETRRLVRRSGDERNRRQGQSGASQRSAQGATQFARLKGDSRKNAQIGGSPPNRPQKREKSVSTRNDAFKPMKIRLLCIAVKTTHRKSPSGVAFLNASLSYSSCFGG